MRTALKTFAIRALGCLVLLVFVSEAAAQQRAYRIESKDYPSLQLPYQDRRRLFDQLLNGEDHLQALALGESILSGASEPPEKVRAHARLALGYSDIGDFARAEQLIHVSREIVRSIGFQFTANGGEAGYRKYLALYSYHRALCQTAIKRYRSREADSDCRITVEYAERARELARFSSRESRNIDSNFITALTERARAESLNGRRMEARRTHGLALDLVRQGLGHDRSNAFAYRVASSFALDVGDYKEAEALARRSIEIWDGTGVSPLYMRRTQGRKVLQDALVVSGRWADAIQEFDSIDAVVQGNEQSESRTRNLLARGLAYAHADRLQTLIPQLNRATQTLQRQLGSNHFQSALREGLLGAARSQSKDLSEWQQAMPTLKHAVEILLAEQGPTEPGEGGALDQAVARFILEKYLELAASVSSVAGTDEGAVAFQVADSMRASTVQGAVQDAAARASAGSGALGDLVRREQDLGNESRALRDFIVHQTAETAERRVDSIVEQMRKRLDEIAALRSGLRAGIARAFPQYAELVRPQAPTPQMVARQLAQGEVFISLLPTDVGIHAWAVSRQGSSYHFSPGATQRVAQLVTALRQSTDIDKSTGRPPQFASQAAHDLYQELLSPLHSLLAQGRHLIVAGGGELGRLAYAALLQKPWEGDEAGQAEWLVKRVAVSQVPSASAWLSVQRLSATTRAQETLAAWGDPRFNNKAQERAGAEALRGAGTVRAVAWTRASKGFDPRAGRTSEEFGYARIPELPETRDELQAIAQALGADAARDLRLGAQATRASVMAANRSGELGRKRVVAFATHGLMAGDLPNLNQPALALAATGNEDKEPLAPLLTLEDVMTLKLNADWVVLSACNTAAGDGMGDEALSGLARGFLYAGSRSLLVTQWAVETESAKLLTTGAFEHYIANPQASKAESLRQSMLRVMQRPEYGHPAYWAPFVLIGDGAR